MRTLIWLAVLAALAWCGYWAVASIGVSRAVSGWLDDREGEAWQAEASVSTAGFPTGFDLILTDLALADPDTGLAWEAPEFRLYAPAWAPTQITATWPPRQTVASPFERIDITTERMDGSLVVAATGDLTLRRGRFELRDMGLTSNAGWSAALASGVLSLRAVDDAALTYDIRFDTRNFRPADTTLARIDPAGLLPKTFEQLVMEARVTFDAPWDRRAIEDRRPQITQIDLRGLKATWGRMLLEAAGDLDVDASGVPEGRITVRAVNWRDMVGVVGATGLVPEGILPTIETALEGLAGLSGRPDTIDAPLSFQKGFVSFGPLPLGAAPDLTLR